MTTLPTFGHASLRGLARLMTPISEPQDNVVENLREMEVETGTLFAYAAGVAAVLGELRLAMYFLPPGDLIAGGLLLLAFFHLTGLTLAYLGGQLDRGTITEHAVFALIGLAIISVFWVWSRST